jgi:hypothetical protein
MKKEEEIMATNLDIEAYFDKLELDYKTVGDGIWILNLEDQGVSNLAISHEPPVLFLRIKLMDAPEKNREQFFQRLLELNLTDLLHGAYALEGNSVVLVDSLQSEHLDLNELQASIESLAFAATQNYEELSSYR